MDVSRAFLVNDPEHAPRGAAFLRGITPARLAMVAAICAMFAARPALWNAELDRAPEALVRWVQLSARWFVFALPIFILVVKAQQLTARAAPPLQVLALSGAVLAGASAFTGIVWMRPAIVASPAFWQWQLSFFMRAAAVGGLLAAIMHIAERERDAERKLHVLRLARAETERQAAETRLHLLQSQIEPHFLFNSLASIKRLYERDPGRGRAMLRNLRDCVNAATARAGQVDVPLSSELALAKSYLEIFQVRMGPRLRVRIDVPRDLESAYVPALMVPTLIENAIKHGISPRASGGTVTISARRNADVLHVEVSDDGVGFRARSGRGVGLANIRARLDALFGKAARLDLASNATGGVTAALRLPCRWAQDGAPAQ